MAHLFHFDENLKKVKFGNIDTSGVTTMEYMFYHCFKLTEVDLELFVGDNLKAVKNMFDSCYSLKSINLPNLSTKQVTDLSNAFYNCRSLENINIKKFDTSQVTKMYCTFYNCTSLKELDLSNFNTLKCSDFTNMFGKIEELTIKLNPRIASNLINLYENIYTIINVTNF